MGNFFALIAVMRFAIRRLEKDREDDRRAWASAREEDRRERNEADAETHRLMHAVHKRLDEFGHRVNEVELEQARLEGVAERLGRLELEAARLGERLAANFGHRPRPLAGATD